MRPRERAQGNRSFTAGVWRKRSLPRGRRVPVAGGLGASGATLVASVVLDGRVAMTAVWRVVGARGQPGGRGCWPRAITLQHWCWSSGKSPKRPGGRRSRRPPPLSGCSATARRAHSAQTGPTTHRDVENDDDGVVRGGLVVAGLVVVVAASCSRGRPYDAVATQGTVLHLTMAAAA